MAEPCAQCFGCRNVSERDVRRKVAEELRGEFAPHLQVSISVEDLAALVLGDHA